MTRISFFRRAAVAACLTATQIAPAFADGAFLILDILPIQEGKTLDQAKAYFGDVEPIFARHGMTRSDAILPVVNIARGDIAATVVNLWQTDDPQAAFKGIFKDPDYLVFTDTRDSIFSMEHATIVVTQRDKG